MVTCRWDVLVFLSLAAMLVASVPEGVAQTLTVTLAWTAPTQHTNGTPATPADIAGYRLYHAATPTGHLVGQQPYVAVAATATQATVPTSYGWYWVVTAVKPGGQESAPSNAVQVVDDSILNAPGTLRMLQVQESRVIQEQRTVVYAQP